MFKKSFLAVTIMTVFKTIKILIKITEMIKLRCQINFLIKFNNKPFFENTINCRINIINDSKLLNQNNLKKNKES